MPPTEETEHNPGQSSAVNDPGKPTSAASLRASGNRPTAAGPKGSVPREAAATEKPDAGSAAGVDTQKPADAIARMMVVKVAAYARGLAAGLGIKVVDPDALRAATADAQGTESVKAALVARVHAAAADAKVTGGVDAETISQAVDEVLEAAANGEYGMVSRKVAEGTAPEPGLDGYLEYPLNPDNLAMHRIESVSSKSRKCWFRMVRQGDILVRSVPPKDGVPGQGVDGSRIDPKPPARPPTLASLGGSNTTVTGDRIVSDIDGACEEDVSGRVRVVSELVVDTVDGTTGSVPDAGVSKSSILVRRDVRSGYSVSSAENVFIGLGRAGGIVEKEVRVSGRNVVVNGKVLGEPQMPGSEPARAGEIQVEDTCVIRETDGAIVGGRRVLVAGDCRRARLDVDDVVGIGGSLIGGVTRCRKILTVGGDLGSEEGGSNMLVVIPSSASASRESTQKAAAGGRLRKQLEEAEAAAAEIERKSAKRATVDAYWSALRSEEVRAPRNALEAGTLRQYREMVNEEKALQHQIQAANAAIAELLQDEDETPADSETVAVRVAGRLFLDVRFEARETVSEDELESEVSFEVDGKRFQGHRLQDLLALLSKKASEYLQARSSAIEERKQAVEKMFEGREKKPTGPRVEHRTFEQAFTWGGDHASEEGILKVTQMAVVETQDPRTLIVVTTAVARDVAAGVEVMAARQGARATFTAGPVGVGNVDWERDPEVLQSLDQILMKGLTAREFFKGAALPVEPVISDADAMEASETVGGDVAETSGPAEAEETVHADDTDGQSQDAVSDREGAEAPRNSDRGQVRPRSGGNKR